MICMPHQTLSDQDGQNMWYVDEKEKYIQGLGVKG